MNQGQNAREESLQRDNVTWRSRKPVKVAAMYLTMVMVSTLAIFFLEHSSLFNAFRTALVAAIGKTIAANWVSGIFD